MRSETDEGTLHFHRLPFGFAIGWRFSSDGEWSVDGVVRRLYWQVSRRGRYACCSVILWSLAVYFGWKTDAAEEG